MSRILVDDVTHFGRAGHAFRMSGGSRILELRRAWLRGVALRIALWLMCLFLWWLLRGSLRVRVHVRPSFGSRQSGRRWKAPCQRFAASRPRSEFSIVIARARP
jgi:hypothetical protein